MERDTLITFVYPGMVNWFYRWQAQLLSDEMSQMGIDATAVASDDILALSQRSGIAVVVSLWECAEGARKCGVGDEFQVQLRCFDQRVLLNYDSIHSHYFVRHFAGRLGLLTAVVDVCMIRQTESDTLYGVPYLWLPESFCQSELQAIPDTPGCRPIPWTMLGHSNTSRVALAAVCIEKLGSGGLLYMPPIRPFDRESGLDRMDLHKVLSATELYIWGSHHSAPYHEGLRALHAVAAGAAPAKIDPLHHAKMSYLPWVYDSVQALVAARERRGVESLFKSAREYLQGFETLGLRLSVVLGLSPTSAVTIGTLTP